MRCIWQMDGDKVKGFKCEFSPIDMLIILSGLRHITEDLDRHPKDRERAQYMYNKIMLSRYEDKLQGDGEIYYKTESQTEYETYLEKIRPHDPHKDWFETDPQTEREDE